LHIAHARFVIFNIPASHEHLLLNENQGV